MTTGTTKRNIGETWEYNKKGILYTATKVGVGQITYKRITPYKVESRSNNRKRAQKRSIGEVWEDKRYKKTKLENGTIINLELINPRLDKKNPINNMGIARQRKVGEKWSLQRKDVWYNCEKLADGRITNVRDTVRSPYVNEGKPGKPKTQHITDKQLAERKAKEARLSANLNNIPRPNEISIKEKPNETASIKIGRDTVIYDPTKRTSEQVTMDYCKKYPHRINPVYYAK